MTAHDRTLHEALAETKALDPSTIRREALKIAATGLAGAEAQAAAARTINEDRAYAEEIHAVLILFLLAGLAIDVSSITRLDFGKTDAVAAAKTVLRQATDPLGVELDTLYARMGCLAETLSFLGLGSFGKPGRLRILLRDLIDFGQSMAVRAKRTKGDVAEFFTFATEVAEHTVALADNILIALDRSLESLDRIVRGWEDQFPRMERRVARLSWLLDGWEYPIAFAKDVDNWAGEDLWLNLETLGRMLPMVPRGEKEDGAEDEHNSRFLNMMQRRRVYAQQDWRTGNLDHELVRRLEDAKSRMIGGDPT
jgi:hypothetical protein